MFFLSGSVSEGGEVVGRGMMGRKEKSRCQQYLPASDRHWQKRGEGWMGPHKGLKINVLLPKENLAGSTLSHSFLCESG